MANLTDNSNLITQIQTALQKKGAKPVIYTLYGSYRLKKDLDINMIIGAGDVNIVEYFGYTSEEIDEGDYWAARIYWENETGTTRIWMPVGQVKFRNYDGGESSEMYFSSDDGDEYVRYSQNDLNVGPYDTDRWRYGDSSDETEWNAKFNPVFEVTSPYPVSAEFYDVFMQCVDDSWDATESPLKEGMNYAFNYLANLKEIRYTEWYFKNVPFDSSSTFPSNVAIYENFKSSGQSYTGIKFENESDEYDDWVTMYYRNSSGSWEKQLTVTSQTQGVISSWTNSQARNISFPYVVSGSWTPYLINILRNSAELIGITNFYAKPE